MMLFLRLIIVYCAFVLAGITPASAQDSVSVRTGNHEGYSRLVFEWPSKPDYSVSKESNRVLLRFNKAAKATIGAAGGNVRKVETLSGPTEPLQVAVTIPEGSKFRDFIVGNKMILDVYDAAGSAPTKEAAKPVDEEPKTETAKVEEPKQKPTEQKPVKEETKGDFSVKPAEPANPAPVEEVHAEPTPAPAIPAHVITLTNTTSAGLAVFTRNGWLWIVNDAPELAGIPQLEGPEKDKLPPLEKIEIPDAVAYRMDLPEGMKVSASGGGLGWKIVLGAKDGVAGAPGPTNEGGKLAWPLKDMRKIITFDDPVIGDKITAVTSIDAGQYTGKARNFVNLQTLDSVVGLAFIGKSDDIVAEKGVDRITVGKPGGLSLSQMKDIQPEKIRQEMQETESGQENPAEVAGTAPATKPEDKTTEEKPAEEVAAPVTKEELSQAAEAKPTGNNVYNFPRWEMGGMAALDNNLHVMMVDISNKKDEARNEDILTMAKLNLANDRAAEALGLMRIVLTKVPELNDNAQLQALRGAALALAGKYDEAIIDLSNETLKKYDDIKYWLAYTLAGLEDWKQAGSVMPANFAGIADYPKVIKTPMILTFAEIALRGGKADLAAQILDLLKDDLPKLPLHQASSWNYLAGETQRQKGNADKAIEYWTPLVKDGKDDLFRAKAGLSLTKLEIDQKKLKTDDAINRLEGLRYAWRGDELETLINFRLGQMYMDNKDYLKGLTVLRNAATLSPESALAKEVKEYMTNKYREVFKNDILKTISPLEAISLHEEFKDLLPIGDEGDQYVEKLAERLVEADLLGRASSLLEYQVNNRLQGDKKAEIAIRLAAIRLLDGNPEGALRSLEIAEATLDKMDGKAPPAAVPAPLPATTSPADLAPEAGEEAKTAATPATTPVAATAPAVKADPEKYRQVFLLRARALSMQKKVNEAMAILEGMRPDPDVNKLRTDIAWTAGKWGDAALALNDLIVAEDISPKRPLTEYQRDLILNRAIALNLSGNRVALSNLRERYNAQMKDTTKGQMFEVVTRPRRPDMIGSREAITSMISEIDLFKGFLDNYAKVEKDKQDKADGKKPEVTKAPASASDKTPVAATSDAKMTTKTLPEVEAKEPSPSPEAKPAEEAKTPAEKATQ